MFYFALCKISLLAVRCLPNGFVFNFVRQDTLREPFRDQCIIYQGILLQPHWDYGRMSIPLMGGAYSWHFKYSISVINTQTHTHTHYGLLFRTRQQGFDNVRVVLSSSLLRYIYIYICQLKVGTWRAKWMFYFGCLWAFHQNEQIMTNLYGNGSAFTFH